MPSLIILIVYAIILFTQIDTRMTCGTSPAFTNFYYYTIAVVVYIVGGYMMMMGLFPSGIKSSIKEGAGLLRKVLPLAIVLSLVFYVGHAGYYFMNRDEIQRAQCKYPWINMFSDISLGVTGGLTLLSVIGVGVFHKKIFGAISA